MILFSTTEQLGPNWAFFVAQLLNFAIIVAALVLFVRAAQAILSRGQGLEVPVWLFLSFLIPVVFPILALKYFRAAKF
jgi:hypothetical protein